MITKYLVGSREDSVDERLCGVIPRPSYRILRSMARMRRHSAAPLVVEWIPMIYAPRPFIQTYWKSPISRITHYSS
ncbi:hypothetical protein J6590_009149 [Homalodisca vitripennis]|nr:hypothetical protein J6590_009149 [Homalodisca vitripennis]